MKLATQRDVERAVSALHDVTDCDLDALAIATRRDPLAVIGALSTFAAAALAIAESRDDDAHELVRDLLAELAALQVQATTRRWAA